MIQKSSTTNYPKHKLKEGDILHVKIIGVQEESFNIFNIENNANNLKQPLQIYF